jgi:hypothetical protein
MNFPGYFALSLGRRSLIRLRFQVKEKCSEEEKKNDANAEYRLKPRLVNHRGRGFLEVN